MPRMVAITVETGGVARITVEGTPNQTYAFEYVDEPMPVWTPLSTSIASTVLFDLFDPVAVSEPHRVYRVRALGIDQFQASGVTGWRPME